MMEIHFIGGNEPYMVDYHVKSAIGKLQASELNLLKANEFNDDVLSFLNTYPVIDERKVVYLTVNDISEVDNDTFHSFLSEQIPFAVLVIRFHKFNMRNPFYKEMSQNGYIKVFNKADTVSHLADFVERRVRKKGASFASPNALKLFLSRENYAERDDITIYNLIHDLDNLIALGTPITEDNICSIVSDNTKTDMYAIAKLILKKDIKGLRMQAALLRDHEIDTLSALLKEYRIAYKSKYFSLNEIGVKYILFSKLEKQQLLDAINIIVDEIDALKLGKVPKSVALENVFFKLI